ncbi:fungal specific transcription factor [Paraphaeosphaeria sporulosa]
MDASPSPAVDVQASDAARDAAAQFEGTPDADEQTSPINDDGEEQPHKTATGPMQKRRRVTRACDECRRKKIKCDGKQPCTHCTVYSYECTYDQPSNRRRTAAPQYIEALETQLKRAKTILSLVFPTLDIGDASIDAHLQSGMLPQFPASQPRPQPIPQPRSAPRRDDPARAEDAADSHLESMVKATGNLDLDEDGNWDYHGHSSGLSFMRRIQQEYGDIIGGKAPSASLFKYRPPSQVLDSPSSAHPSPADSTVLPAGTDLPPKKIARTLCDSALVDASAMLRVVHLPSFYKSLDRIYDTTPENYGNAENTFLPLLYAVLALGSLFPKANNQELAGVEGAADEGYKYFRASRQLLDVTDCRDLTSVQAIVFMIQFLQSTAKLSTCYSYIGVALRSAIRMGMHRSFNVNFTPIEAETRKRLFWAIWRMDTYVGAMLGLPHFIEDDDVDQDYPTEVDDEYITETEILAMPEGKISIMHASNAHVKIVRILSKICKYVYPTKGTQSGGKHSVTYSVSYAKIREIEQSMQQWLDELPMALKPGGEAPPIILRVQQLLRMAFAHAQLLLYRPFLHYVSSSERSKASVDQRAFACASACISVSRNIIHISAEMKKRGLLVGAYWFSMYTTFFAIISILYFVLENPTSQTSRELFRDALEGKELLDYFAKRSLAADRCSETLKSIFDRLPESVKRGGAVAPTDTKKRRQASSPQSMHARPHALKQDSDFVAMGVRRASTFPETMPPNGKTTLPLSQSHLSSLGIDRFNSATPGSDYFDQTPSLTPTSATPSSLGSYGLASGPPHTRPGQPFAGSPLTTMADASGLNVDMNTLMFPSADPLAYPNQPMTTFEDSHPQAYQFKHGSPIMAQLPPQYTGIDIKPSPASYAPSPMANIRTGTGRPDNEVQLLGPMPMYLMQGAQHRSFHPQPGVHGPPPPQIPGQNPANMSFDEIFGGEEWAQTFMDPGLGLSGGPGYGGPPHFGAGAPNMGGWQ